MEILRKDGVIVWLFVLVLIISIPPFFVWNAWNYLSKVVYIFGILLLMIWKKPEIASRRFSLLFFFLFYVFASIHQYEEKNFTGTLWTLFRSFIPFTLFLISEEKWVAIYGKFVTIYSITLIPSFIVYLLVVWGDVNIPHVVMPPHNIVKDYSYFQYPFLVTIDQYEDLFRFHGYYDEPGVIGTISGVLLVVNRCNMKEWKNVILLISGLFSFSLFFYVLLVSYLLLFSSKKTKLLTILCMLLAYSYLVNDNGPFSELIMSRLEFSTNGEWSGDNRTTDQFYTFYKKFLDSDELWFGYGMEYSNLVADTGGASYKHLIVDFGIIMFILYVVAFFLFYISHKVSAKSFLLLMVILSSVLFQRPFIFSFIYLFLLIAPASMLSLEKKI